MRQCFYIVETMRDENGFIPVLVTENEPGYAPLSGNGPQSRPWYWGKTYAEARRVCDQANRTDFGIEPAEQMQIVASSMRAGNVTPPRPAPLTP